MTTSVIGPAHAYADLSRRYAVAGDLRMALLAAWSSDLHVLEELLWSNGLEQAPDPAAELAAIGANVAASVEAAAAGLADDGPTARELAETARRALVTTFDPSVHELLTDRFEDLSHLDSCPRPERDADPVERTSARLAGLSAEALAAELRTAAADCAAMAEMLLAGGEQDAGHRMARQSDAAAFEAHLVTAAVRAGDDALVTVDLRWDLVAGQDPTAERLLEAVGSAEKDALRHTLEPSAAP